MKIKTKIETETCCFECYFQIAVIDSWLFFTPFFAADDIWKLVFFFLVKWLITQSQDCPTSFWFAWLVAISINRLFWTHPLNVWTFDIYLNLFMKIFCKNSCVFENKHFSFFFFFFFIPAIQVPGAWRDLQPMVFLPDCKQKRRESWCECASQFSLRGQSSHTHPTGLSKTKQKTLKNLRFK